MSDGQLTKLLASAREKWIAANHQRARPQLSHERKDRIKPRSVSVDVKGHGGVRMVAVVSCTGPSTIVSAAGVVVFMSRPTTTASLGINLMHQLELASA